MAQLSGQPDGWLPVKGDVYLLIQSAEVSVRVWSYGKAAGNASWWTGVRGNNKVTAALSLSAYLTFDPFGVPSLFRHLSVF